MRRREEAMVVAALQDYRRVTFTGADATFPRRLSTMYGGMIMLFLPAGTL